MYSKQGNAQVWWSDGAESQGVRVEGTPGAALLPWLPQGSGTGEAKEGRREPVMRWGEKAEEGGSQGKDETRFSTCEGAELTGKKPKSWEGEGPGV